MRFIDRVGIELEGTWQNSDSWLEEHIPNSQWHRDGSVSSNGAPAGMRSCGELVVKDPIQVADVAGWMRAAYPQFVNDTCGLHVHLSVMKEEMYLALARPAFYEDFKAWAKAWGTAAGLAPSHEFHRRLRGDNQYCQAGFEPERQMALRDRASVRYRALNFSWHLHKTLECRLLPCFKDSEMAISAVESYIAFVDAWLKANFKRGLLPQRAVLFEAPPNIGQEPVPDLVEVLCAS